MLSALGRLSGEPSWNQRARRVLAAISKPTLLRDQGRMTGDYLLALDDADALAW